MLKNIIVISKSTDPYCNLAMEEYIFNNIKKNEVIFYLWQNHKTVVIGRNQNPYIECDVDYIEGNGAKIARRMSGGGTVYHDLGNLNFTFVTSKENHNIEKQILVIKKAIEKFGLSVDKSGRNDLTINNKKFSGHAFYEDDNKMFHHGTIMIDVDKLELNNILKPSKIKLKSKGIDSVKSRVINLKECNNDITLNDVFKNLIESFKEVYGDVYSIRETIGKEVKGNLLEKYKNHKWVYGESPEFNVNLETPTDIGNIQILMDIKDNVVKKVRVYSDSLNQISFSDLEQLIVKQEFNRENILKTVYYFLESFK